MFIWFYLLDGVLCFWLWWNNGSVDRHLSDNDHWNHLLFVSSWDDINTNILQQINFKDNRYRNALTQFKQKRVSDKRTLILLKVYWSHINKIFLELITINLTYFHMYILTFSCTNFDCIYLLKSWIFSTRFPSRTDQQVSPILALVELRNTAFLETHITL